MIQKLLLMMAMMIKMKMLTRNKISKKNSNKFINGILIHRDSHSHCSLQAFLIARLNIFYITKTPMICQDYVKKSWHVIFFFFFTAVLVFVCHVGFASGTVC